MKINIKFLILISFISKHKCIILTIERKLKIFKKLKRMKMLYNWQKYIILRNPQSLALKKKREKWNITWMINISLIFLYSKICTIWLLKKYNINTFIIKTIVILLILMINFVLNQF